MQRTRVSSLAIGIIGAVIALTGALGYGARPASANTCDITSHPYGCTPPENARATAGNGQVTLSWRPPSRSATQAAAPNLNGYHLYRYLNGISLSEVARLSSTTLSYIDSPVAAGGASYSICAVYGSVTFGDDEECTFASTGNSGAGSGSSGSGGGGGGGGASAPHQSPDYCCQGLHLTLTNRTETSLTVVWNGDDITGHANDNIGDSVEIVCLGLGGKSQCNGSPQDGGSVHQKREGDYLKILGLSQSGSYTFSNLGRSHSYQFAACEVRGQSRDSENRNCFSANPGSSSPFAPIFWTLPQPVAPSNLYLVKQTGDNSALIGFDSGSGGDGIQVYCWDRTTSTPCIPYTIAGDATSASLTGLVDEHDYLVTLFRVEFSDETTTLIKSDPLTLHLVRLSPPTPTNLHVGERTDSKLVLNWDDNTDQSTANFDTDVYRDGVKLAPPPGIPADSIEVETDLSQILGGESAFVDYNPPARTAPAAQAHNTTYKVCTVYRRYRGTPDEALRTSCSTPLTVYTFPLQNSTTANPTLPHL